MRQLSPAIALAALAACSSDTSVPVEPACNPLGDVVCLAPWPSSVFEIEDPGSPTGRRLAIPAGALPGNADPAGWNLADGFSPIAPLVVAWRGGVSPDGLPPPGDPSRSLADDSPTVLLDMTTGARVAHTVELGSPPADPLASQAMIMRPEARLTAGHRYAVAVTSRVRAADGSELAVPIGFAALRDHKSTDHALLEAMRPRFADVLDALDAAGSPADQLVLAWDFTVASGELGRRDRAALQGRALAAIAAGPAAFAITADAPIGDGARIARRITGTLDAPVFLTQHGAPDPGTVIARDGDGLPALQGTAPIPFTALVPACALAAKAPVAMVLYGHAVFGSADDVSGERAQAAAAASCTVIAATELRGLSEIDLPAVARMLGELTTADEAIDAAWQGLVNQLALATAMRGVLARELFVDPARPGRPSRSLVDPTRLSYDGAAQPAGLAATVRSYATTTAPAAAAPADAPAAASYPALLEASAEWPEYREILAVAYPDPIDAELALGLVQMRWDRVVAAP